MTKAEVAAQIADLTQKDKETIALVIPALLETIMATLANGQRILVDGFGSFYPLLRNDTTGRDIHRDALIRIPAHYIPAFKPYDDFRRQVGLAQEKQGEQVACLE